VIWPTWFEMVNILSEVCQLSLLKLRFFKILCWNDDARALLKYIIDTVVTTLSHSAVCKYMYPVCNYLSGTSILCTL